jgi:hypothetical protein
MKRYAIIKDNQVIDSILWQGEGQWNYPRPHDQVIESNTLKIGMYKSGDEWLSPPFAENEELTDSEILDILLERNED